MLLEKHITLVNLDIYNFFKNKEDNTIFFLNALKTDCKTSDKKMKNCYNFYG